MAIPCHLEYLRIYFQAWACIAHRRNEESWRTFQQRVYTILIRLTRQGNEEPKMCTVTFKPEIAWSVMWKNLRRAILSAEIRSMRYMVIHGVLPTNDSLKVYSLLLVRFFNIFFLSTSYLFKEPVLYEKTVE
jgi:hypothetical protein